MTPVASSRSLSRPVYLSPTFISLPRNDWLRIETMIGEQHIHVVAREWTRLHIGRVTGRMRIVSEHP
jgi:hypothetical protein